MNLTREGAQRYLDLTAEQPQQALHLILQRYHNRSLVSYIPKLDRAHSTMLEAEKEESESGVSEMEDYSGTTAVLRALVRKVVL